MASTTLRIALVLLASSATLAAQGNKPAAGGRNTEAQQQELQKQREIEAADDGSAGIKSGDVKEAVDNLENLTPEQRLERGTRSGASNYCRFIASIRPARLLPGQTGTMYVVASLQGQAVLTAPAPLQVTSPAQQGIVTLGAPTFHPAEPGRLAKGYLGVPVYDNTAILEIPVTVAANAPIGQKQAVNVDLKFDLYDGVTTQVVGRFVDRAVAEVEVGRSADPSVSMPVVEQQGAPVDAARSERAPVAGDGDSVGVRPSALAGDAAVPAPAPAATVEPQPRDMVTEGPPAPEGGGSTHLLLLGGGALVLLLVVMLVRRK